MELPIELTKTMPRKHKRRVWKNWFKYRRDTFAGATRAEKRRNWREIWQQLRTVGS